MKRNMGNSDRVIRIIVAAILVGLYFSEVVTGTIGIISLIVAGVFALTSLVSFCPLYTLFGIKTCKTSSVN
jgi:hypothetical protein